MRLVQLRTNRSIGGLKGRLVQLPRGRNPDRGWIILNQSRCKELMSCFDHRRIPIANLESVLSAARIANNCRAMAESGDSNQAQAIIQKIALQKS
jgi:hypothetical protein